jgi:bifunctional UDP-N-acetylglucosamine pyrophosphorylase / glucosamine-1-phosphate N-acetyltransferase
MKVMSAPHHTGSLEVVILAAGKGTRMRSSRPKVLHKLAGRPLVEHVVHIARELGAQAVHVVYGHGGEAVPQQLKHLSVNWVKQEPQLGTGHAVQQAMPAVKGDTVLVLYGDVPLTRLATLQALMQAAAGGGLAVLTATLADPAGYGRIVRDAAGKVTRIVEHKDASEKERAITEINTGILAAPAAKMRAWLQQLRNDNVQKEYYLTDIIRLAVEEGVAVTTASPQAEWEILGVNSKQQLAELERIHQRNQANALMEQGVTLMDPARFDLRGELECGQDVEIDINVIIEGQVSLGDRVKIGAHTLLRNCRIDADTIVQPHCVIEEANVGRDCRIGPFSRLRPEARLADRAHIGNFVEIKKSEIGVGSKVNHLAYVGDSIVGADVNIGAGSITANYDGANKHRTHIGDRASIGSNCVLVAPVEIGAGATIGAGSVINKDAPAGELTVARAKAVTIPGWKRPVKKK